VPEAEPLPINAHRLFVAPISQHQVAGGCRKLHAVGVAGKKRGVTRGG
jgi:hypothetical protein